MHNTQRPMPQAMQPWVEKMTAYDGQGGRVCDPSPSFLDAAIARVVQVIASLASAAQKAPHPAFGHPLPEGEGFSSFGCAILIVPTLQRGNASWDALRPGLLRAIQGEIRAVSTSLTPAPLPEGEELLTGRGFPL